MTVYLFDSVRRAAHLNGLPSLIDNARVYVGVYDEEHCGMSRTIGRSCDLESEGEAFQDQRNG